MAHNQLHLDSPNALFRLSARYNRRIDDVIDGEGWTYAKYSWDLDRDSRHKGPSVEYGVLMVILSRELPNVFFDSKNAAGKQYGFHFPKSQKHSLEGDFDKYFATYFAEDYTVDSMSFIAPDVMWRIREAANYDIEIFKNRLFLYGKYEASDELMNDMAQKALAIQRSLQENISNYRDERLPYDRGRLTVTPQGMHLKNRAHATSQEIIGGVIIGIAFIFILFAVIAEWFRRN